MRESVCVFVWPSVFDGRGEGGIRGLETVISPLLAMKKEKEGFADGCFLIFEVTGFYRFLETHKLYATFAKILKTPPKQKKKKKLP